MSQQNGIVNALMESLANWNETMDATSKSFHDSIDSQNLESDKIVSQFGQRLNGRHKPAPELSPDIQKIVGALQAMPELVPIVMRQVDTYMAEITAAVNAVKAKYAQQETNGNNHSEES